MPSSPVSLSTPSSSPLHIDLTLPASTKSIFVIGDVHGALTELKEILAKIRANNTNPTIVLVGDLVNKGPQSAQTVKFCRAEGLLSVKGNHDHSAVRRIDECIPTPSCYDDGSDSKDDPYAYLRELDDLDVKYLRDLPLSVTVFREVDLSSSAVAAGIIIVHAGIVPGVKLQDQKMRDLTEIRNVKTLSPIEPNSVWESVYGEEHVNTQIDIVKNWAEVYNDILLNAETSTSEPSKNPVVVYGHDAKLGRTGSCKYYAIPLDTGCCYGKLLTAVEINLDDLSKRAYYEVKAKAVYEEPGARRKEMERRKREGEGCVVKS